MKKSIPFLVFNLLFYTSILFSQSNDTNINRYNINGKKHGKWITYDYFEGDSLKHVCYYKNGLLNGKSITYYSNGKINCETNFINDNKEGKSKIYYNDGALSHLFLYKKDSLLLHIKFTNRGTIFQESNGEKVIQYTNGIPMEN